MANAQEGYCRLLCICNAGHQLCMENIGIRGCQSFNQVIKFDPADFAKGVLIGAEKANFVSSGFCIVFQERRKTDQGWVGEPSLLAPLSLSPKKGAPAYLSEHGCPCSYQSAFKRLSAVAEGSTESFDEGEEVFSRSAVAMGAMSDSSRRDQLRLQGPESE